jgi:NADH:quinone reductase (non-electrogenic)
LGASGVNCGTLFCVTQESNWPNSFKKAVLNASENDTVLIFRNLHNTARVFKNECAKKVHEIEFEKGKNIKFQDIMELVGGKRGREAEKNDDSESGIWSAGQGVGLIEDVPTCDQLIKRIISEACQTFENLNSIFVKSKL